MFKKLNDESSIERKKQGDLGENIGYWFIKMYLPKLLTQFDYIYNEDTKNIFEAKLAYRQRKHKWVIIEIKHKDPYVYNNSNYTGLNAYQAENRMEYLKDTNQRCMLLIIEHTGDGIYYKYLDELYPYKEYTKNQQIMIFNYKYFNHISKSKFLNELSIYIQKLRLNGNCQEISDDLANLLNIESHKSYKDKLKTKKIKEHLRLLNTL